MQTCPKSASLAIAVFIGTAALAQTACNIQPPDGFANPGEGPSSNPGGDGQGNDGGAFDNASSGLEGRGASDDSTAPDGGDESTDTPDPEGDDAGADTSGGDDGTDPDGGFDDAGLPGQAVDGGAGDPVVRTAATGVDSDEDGFSDAVERSGAKLGVNLHAYKASPTHKDVFLYVDYYTRPKAAAIKRVVDAFAAAPLANLDGKGGIALHIFWGRRIPAARQISNIIGPCPNSDDVASSWSQFDTIKARYFPKRWAKVAHYALFGNQISSDSGSGCSRGIPGHDLIVSLGTPEWAGGTELEQSGTLMHELGHNLGLAHFGPLKRVAFPEDGSDMPYQPNYLSIMSYAYQTYGLNRDGQDGVLDYSRVEIDGLDESALDENAGMQPLGTTTTTELARYGAKFWFTEARAVLGTCEGPLDFNDNGAYDPTPQQVDLDKSDGLNVIPRSWNDWVDLQYQGLADGGGVIGDVVPVGNGRVVDPGSSVSPDDMPAELSKH
jgi:hypothetical protein